MFSEILYKRLVLPPPPSIVCSLSPSVTERTTLSGGDFTRLHSYAASSSEKNPSRVNPAVKSQPESNFSFCFLQYKIKFHKNNRKHPILVFVNFITSENLPDQIRRPTEGRQGERQLVMSHTSQRKHRRRTRETADWICPNRSMHHILSTRHITSRPTSVHLG